MVHLDSDSLKDSGEARRDIKGSAASIAQRGLKVRAILRTRLGEDVFNSWFASLEFHAVEDGTLKVSVAVKFLKNWIGSHYGEQLLTCCQMEFEDAERIDVSVREPAPANARQSAPTITNSAGELVSDPVRDSDRRSPPASAARTNSAVYARPVPGSAEGSPLDPKCTFETFVVGSSNRMAHAAAIQVAETVFAEDRGFNPLFLHSAVGLGKSHLLHAIAWEVKRRKPTANILYLTAERFRFEFVEALKAQQAMAFKDRFRNIDILLIDDLEFMQGEKTEQEFEHIINTLLDGGRQVVVASARPPGQLERMNDRMRSRLQRGLVTEIGTLDAELRMKILEKRVQDKRASDPSFELPRDVLEILADRLTESGRELEGAVNRLFATWQLVRSPISAETVDAVIRDLVQGIEPRRIKIEDILRIVSRHYAVSKSDILSQRRHRSVVWPRQIGMYLAKQMTSRSLPEIGRRFGDRDHTTVLHAIRKIEKEMDGNTRLRDELEELKKQINR